MFPCVFFQYVLNMEVTKQMSKKIIDASRMLKSRADDNAFDSSDVCVIDGICQALSAFALDLVNRAKSFELPALPEVVEVEMCLNPDSVTRCIELTGRFIDSFVT